MLDRVLTTGSLSLLAKAMGYNLNEFASREDSINTQSFHFIQLMQSQGYLSKLGILFDALDSLAKSISPEALSDLSRQFSTPVDAYAQQDRLKTLDSVKLVSQDLGISVDEAASALNTVLAAQNINTLAQKLGMQEVDIQSALNPQKHVGLKKHSKTLAALLVILVSAQKARRTQEFITKAKELMPAATAAKANMLDRIQL